MSEPLDPRTARVAQLVWLGLALAIGALGLVGLVARWNQIETVCHRACASGQLDVTTVHTLHSFGISLTMFAIYSLAFAVLVHLIWYGVAAIIIWRKPDDRGALAAAFFLILFQANDDSLVSVVGSQVVSVLGIFGGCALIAFICLFPDGRFTPPWTRWLMIGGIVIAAAGTVNPAFVPADLMVAINNIGLLITVLALIGVQVYRFRYASTWAQRQQTKWAFLGLIIALLGLAILNLPDAIAPSQTGPGTGYDAFSFTAFPVTFSAIPVTIGIAILRYRLWDVDQVINRALVYGLLTISLVLAYIGLVVGLQALVIAVTGQSSDLAIALSTLIVAALFNPLRRGLQVFIDRRFYRRKYDTVRTLAGFQARLRDTVDLDQLQADLLTVTRETMQPASVSLWLWQDSGEASS